MKSPSASGSEKCEVVKNLVIEQVNLDMNTQNNSYVLLPILLNAIEDFIWSKACAIRYVQLVRHL